MRRRFQLSLLAILLVTLFSGGQAVSIDDVPLAGRDISLSVVSANGASMQLTFAPQDLLLMATTTTFKTGDTVKQLLITNGIFPDAEGFGLVYDLNPALPSLTAIAPGTQIILPKLSTESRLLIPAGDLVALKVDASLKDQLMIAIEGLQERITTTRDFNSSHYDNADDRPATRDALKSINDSIAAIANVIRGKVRPIQSEVLNQVKAEADALRGALDRLGDPSRRLSADDVSTIKLIEADLKVRRRTLTDVRDPSEPPTRWREATVVVKTIGANGQAVPQLRIYYVPEALRGRPQFIRSFDALSSPSQRSLPEANYVIWAANPGETAEAAARSDVKRLAVRRSSDSSIAVDLAIIR
ncbi:MAG TPA: hypothetical protein VNG71_21590 [Pyrinomonadaceae bacterium]|nr:hypothetical protein [Pyrinomonadaceae bacterium]